MLGIEQKKGSDDVLNGRIIAYAKILPEPGNTKTETPFGDMVKNGLLVLEGDFKIFSSLPSRKVVNSEVDDRINNMLQSMEESGIEIPPEIDVDSMRDRLHELSNMEVIPIPARIGNFESEEDILKEDADIFYIGEFIGASQAHFCLTMLPVYYQARYREQVRRKEIDNLNDALLQFENSDFVGDADLQKDSNELFPKGVSLNTFCGDLENLLNSRVIPFLLSLKTDDEYNKQIKLFYEFMKSYPVKADLRLIDTSLKNIRYNRISEDSKKLLELGCKKINAIYNEDAKTASELSDEIIKIVKSRMFGEM